MPETTQFAGMGGDGVGGGDGLKPNTILLARYKVLGVLGGGGMGTVYQARDLNFPDVKRLVAIKEMLNPNTDPNLRASTLKTFQREANILATLTHPAIPKIFDFFDQNDRAYLVMEYINGVDMENMMAKVKEIPIEKVLEWSTDLCDVLDYLHKNQPEPIIFRDMKPSNVMIDNLGKVRLIDFGIAKNFVSGVKNTMIGTEGYSAPEQYKGDVNPLSDIYSLGATLHHLLTRRDPRLEPPFSFNERPIKDFNPKATQGIIDIVMKALSFEAKDRFQSCADMKASLERLRYAPIQQVVATSVAPKSSAGTGVADGTSFFDDPDSGELKAGVQPKWVFKTEDEIRCSPASYKNLAYIGSYDTNVWALQLDTGEFVWKFPTRGGIASSPVVDNDTRLVIFGSEDYSLTAVDANSGRISWTYPTKDKIRSTARVAHGHVFFGSDDGRVYAVVAANGRYLWEYDTGAPVRSRPFVTNDIVIVGSDSGEIIGLELAGKRKWSYRTKRSVTSSPYVDMLESICYVGSGDGFLYAIDANSGYSSWRYRTNGPIYSSPVVEDGICYFGSTDGILYALNAQTSREKWKFETGKAIISSPIVHKGAVYFGGTDGHMYCVDATTGKERWKFLTKGGITSTPYIADNTILVGSVDKTLYAFPLVG
jgi:serine/threonine protein kinase